MRLKRPKRLRPTLYTMRTLENAVNDVKRCVMFHSFILLILLILYSLYYYHYSIRLLLIVPLYMYLSLLGYMYLFVVVSFGIYYSPHIFDYLKLAERKKRKTRFLENLRSSMTTTSVTDLVITIPYFYCTPNPLLRSKELLSLLDFRSREIVTCHIRLHRLCSVVNTLRNRSLYASVRCSEIEG